MTGSTLWGIPPARADSRVSPCNCQHEPVAPHALVGSGTVFPVGSVQSLLGVDLVGLSLAEPLCNSLSGAGGARQVPCGTLHPLSIFHLARYRNKTRL